MTQSPSSSRAQECKALIRLSVPVVIAQLGAMMLGMVDTFMVGHLGKDELAAVGIGDTWSFGCMIFGMGIISGMDPLITQANGAKKYHVLGLTLQRGLVLSVLLNLPLGLLWLYGGDCLKLLGQNEAHSDMAQSYLNMQWWSIAPFLCFMSLRSYLQGRELVIGPLVIIIIANVFNLIVNWGLIYGHFGFGNMGIEGAGLATGLTRAFMFIALVAWVLYKREHHGAWQAWSRKSFSFSGLSQVLKYGWIIALQSGFEVWAFTFCTFFAGFLQPVNVNMSAQIIALKLMSFTFMMPLGISIAATTRVGNLLGAGEPKKAQESAILALGLGALVMLCSAVFFIVFQKQLPALFISREEQEVILLASSILPIAAAFQLFDGIQVVGSGVLRGMGKPTPALLTNLLAFYVIGLPLALWFTFDTIPKTSIQGLDAGLQGIWWGLATALFVAAICLFAYVLFRGPSKVKRLDLTS